VILAAANEVNIDRPGHVFSLNFFGSIWRV